MCATDSLAQVEQRSRFLARVDLFEPLSYAKRTKVAESITEREVPAGESLLVEGGLPGEYLYVVRRGTFELLHNQVVVAFIPEGEVFGHPTLLTGLAPEFTTRARVDSLVYCIPGDIALAILSRPAGVQWLAASQRERLIQAARTIEALPHIRTRPVSAVMRKDPLFCDPDTTIREAAEKLIAGGRSAILVRTRDGLGMVTDVDLRDKVVVGGISPEAPVTAIMSTPVHTIGVDALAPEASIAMIITGVNHLPVVDADGAVVGYVSASSLMGLEARSPFAVRRALHSAKNEAEVLAAAADVPKLFMDLLDMHLDAPSLMRVITVLQDAMTVRLLELSFERHGEPPVPYAWLAFGSGARNELTLASDQDNGLAYDDAADPAVDDYFLRVATDVNLGLEKCGFVQDPHGVLSRYEAWRMPLSGWKKACVDCLEGDDFVRLARATVTFDYRQVAGELFVEKALTDIMRDAHLHKKFLGGLARIGSNIPSPLNFRGRLHYPFDIKKDALVAVENLARYYAFARGITANTTLERLVAVEEADGPGGTSEQSLREAFISMSQLRLRHHADAIRRGAPPDNIISPADLRPVARVTLQESLRVVAAAQKRFPRLAKLF